MARELERAALAGRGETTWSEAAWAVMAADIRGRSRATAARSAVRGDRLSPLRAAVELRAAAEYRQRAGGTAAGAMVVQPRLPGREAASVVMEMARFFLNGIPARPAAEVAVAEPQS